MTTASASSGPSTHHVTPPEDWVPADRRWAGFDRRTVGPALFVLVFMLLMHFGLPALNDAVAYDDRVEPGDQLALTQGITFTPVPGWNLEDGLRTDESGDGKPSALVTDGDVTFKVTVGPFSGDARALAEQVKETTDVLNGADDLHVTGDAAAVTTDSGLGGVLIHYSSADAEGVLGAFVVDDHGITVEATGAGTLSDGDVRDIAAMIASLRAEGDAA